MIDVECHFVLNFNRKLQLDLVVSGSQEIDSSNLVLNLRKNDD